MKGCNSFENLTEQEASEEDGRGADNDSEIAVEVDAWEVEVGG